MEIIKSEENLRAEILSDAKIKAERILRRVEDEIKKQKEELNTIIEEKRIQTEDKYKKEAEIEIDKINASIDIEIKKQRESIIGKIIDDLFFSLKESILSEKYFLYRDFMLKLIENALFHINSSLYILEATADEITKLGKDSLRKMHIDQIIETNKNGIRIFSGERNKMVYILLDDFIEKLKEKERNNIYDILIR